MGDKAVSTLFDNSKIKRLVPDFQCAIPYAEGIKRTLQAFEADPSRQIVAPATNIFIEELIAETLERA